ncbi:MAG TPA: tRNA (adenosine(37)-N6)-threonylcarbamoyltransferase complex dimerization subunit type 1 TsaB [Solirubrobacteraceae bacterium]|nr:tRNA (adenosine(37)-N6)-threonylcarbamoyltransferase complex dimerization subunit type 1 TsaB [Solirubrobacteraceae bacterium]
MILGLDTATASTAVGLWAPGGPEIERRDDPPLGARPAHAGRLLLLVEEVLAAAGADWGAVERIAVGVGPGSFTGLRLGIATARGLAQARALPLVGVSSLAALAAGARADLAVIDARRGEVFAAAQDRFGPVALAPEELAARIEPGWLAVGDGAVRFREPLERAGAVIPADDASQHRVSALQICRLGAVGQPADRDALLPDYRREPDAKPREP